MPSSKSNLRILKKKPPAKKRWTAARSKPSATSGAKPKLPPAPKAAAERGEVLKRLRRHYPDAHCELVHENPFQLLVATVLSAQCTDVLVNKVTPGLFAELPTPAKMAAAPLEKINELVRAVNFNTTKAKNLKSLAADLVAEHGGEVPRTVDELTELAGVGRKTANVVLGNAFNIASGIVVDTHVGRLSRRFGWTKSEDALKIEEDLRAFVPQDRWVLISHELIFHGRRVCKARAPLCGSCFLLDLCPRKGVEAQA